MKGKILLLVGLGVGYVLGAKAGRERYNEIVEKARSFWNDPRVQKQVNQAEEFVKDKAPEVADFISDNAKKVAGQVKKPATKPAARKPASSTGSTSAKK